MEDNPIYIYINKVNQTTITNLINDIIESSQTNNNQKIIISFIHPVENIGYTNFSSIQIRHVITSTVYHIQNNFYKQNIFPFIEYLCKALNSSKKKSIDISLNWQLFYKIFYIYSYDTIND